MGKRKYSTREHRAERKRWAPVVEAGEAYCSEVICLVEQDGGDRWIPPGSAWDVCHTEDGLDYRGPGHSKCNRSEGATRGNRQRGGMTRWVL